VVLRMSLPPRSPSIFPYTTLFRSCRHHPAEQPATLSPARSERPLPPIRFDVRERLDLLRGTRTHEQTVRGRGGRGPHLGRRHHQIGRAHVCTPVTFRPRVPSSACN